MSHRVIIINSVVVEAAAGSHQIHPEIEASVTYRPSDATSVHECGKTVARILKRLPGIADGPDE